MISNHKPSATFRLFSNTLRNNNTLNVMLFLHYTYSIKVFISFLKFLVLY